VTGSYGLTPPDLEGLLEPDAGRLASPVPRGARPSNGPALPDERDRQLASLANDSLGDQGVTSSQTGGRALAMNAIVAVEVRRCGVARAAGRCAGRGSAPRSRSSALLSEKPGSGPHPAGLPGRRLRLLARRTHVSNVASGGGTRRRKTARPGPSPAGEWMLSGAEDSLTQLGELLGRTPSRSRCDTPLPTRTATAASSAAPTDGPAGHRSTSQARLATTFRPLRLLRLLRLL